MTRLWALRVGFIGLTIVAAMGMLNHSIIGILFPNADYYQETGFAYYLRRFLSEGWAAFAAALTSFYGFYRYNVMKDADPRP